MLTISSVLASLSDGESLDDAVLPVPESVLPQTKVPLYGRDHISSRKAQAMKQAKDRKKQLARLGPTSNLDFSPFSLDKLEPEFVSEAGIREKTDSAQRDVLAPLINHFSQPYSVGMLATKQHLTCNQTNL